jgi:2-polyprenyl-3-methyl-5-hydroxy-6-metoxy-1,4-benzoquinol methylase
MLLASKGNGSNIAICQVCDTLVNKIKYDYFTKETRSSIYSCSECGLMFLFPVVLPELEDRKMEGVDDAELFNNTLLKKLHEKLIVKREIYEVRKRLGRGHLSLLDIGCGTGWTTSIWKKEGFDVAGVEPSRQRGEYAQKTYGINIIEGYIEQIPLEGKYDVIVIRHVLEHIEKPVPALHKLRQLMKKGGLLVVIVPNIRCIGRYLFKTDWSWVLPAHCLFFSPKSLARAVSQVDFTVVKTYQTPSPLWYPESFLRAFSQFSLITKAYNKLSCLFFVPFLPLILLGYFTGFSENLTVIAKANDEADGDETG